MSEQMKLSICKSIAYGEPWEKSQKCTNVASKKYLRLSLKWRTKLRGTNYISIHLCADGQIRNKAEYEAYTGS